MTQSHFGTTLSLVCMAALAIMAWAATGAAAQNPTPLPVPCSSAANKTLADACLLTLALTHLGYEETGQWGPLLDTMSADAYEVYGHTLMGGVNTAPPTSDQSIHHMYANILNGGQPADLVYVPVTTTVGTSTIVYEYITQFNHTLKIEPITKHHAGIPAVSSRQQIHAPPSFGRVSTVRDHRAGGVSPKVGRSDAAVDPLLPTLVRCWSVLPVQVSRGHVGVASPLGDEAKPDATGAVPVTVGDVGAGVALKSIVASKLGGLDMATVSAGLGLYMTVRT